MPMTITYTEKLTVMTCWCGINHAVPEDLAAYQQRQHDDGKTVTNIYCPLGHTHVPAGKPKWKTHQERAERSDAALRAEKDQHRAERAAHAATKGKLTKVTKRAERGVCQHCHRSFVDVARHVKTKHPEALA